MRMKEGSEMDEMFSRALLVTGGFVVLGGVTFWMVLQMLVKALLLLT